ncbi:MAG: response regulator transcription factor [Rhodocyclales bacterium]|nr:response regulator transcription factor [Rhodocyclales bacterium]
MASRATKSPSHLFVSPSGRALPRWEEAFPRLRCLKAGMPLGVVEVSGLVWLRLDPAHPALAQVERLLAERPGIQLIVLADQPDDEQALPLFSAGIRAYINAHSTAANLKQVAQVVAAGGLWLGPSLMARLVAATSRALAAASATALDPRLSALTQRELEVARKIAGGASNKEVARALDIAERTVKAHAGAIFEKLGARDRLHLALIMNGRDPEAASVRGSAGSGGGAGRKPVKRAADARCDPAEDARDTAVGLKAHPANR